jgi:hypothetical protein
MKNIKLMKKTSEKYQHGKMAANENNENNQPAAMAAA